LYISSVRPQHFNNTQTVSVPALYVEGLVLEFRRGDQLF